MATTCKPIDILAEGLRDTAGAVLASANIRFYTPGTLTAATVYSDSLCTTAYAQPITANAGGQATVYALGAVRMIAKNAADTTQYYDGIVNLQRAEAVYMTVTGFNSGNESTLATELATASTAFGAGFQYKESATATARNWTSVIRTLGIQALDFGVVGDGSTDDTTALQNAINRVAALGGGKLILPTGTIKITSALTISTAGVSIEGQGRGISIIKNFSTTGNALNVTLSSGDCKLYLRGFSITANTTSSGTAINCSVGNYITLQDVSTGLHRIGIDVSAITGGDVRHCLIDSTDGNTAAIGIKLGSSGRAWHCELTGSSALGIGVSFASTDARAMDCYATGFATGFSLASARSIVRDCFALSCTTGYLVGAVANATVATSGGSSNTTDMSVNASATLFYESGNMFTGTVTNSGASNIMGPVRFRSGITTSASASPTFTPDISNGQNFQVFHATNAAGASLTIANHATATLTPGDVMWLTLVKTNATNMTISSWGSQYKSLDGSVAPSSTAIQTNFHADWIFKWDGTIWRAVFQQVSVGF